MRKSIQEGFRRFLRMEGPAHSPTSAQAHDNARGLAFEIDVVHASTHFARADSGSAVRFAVTAALECGVAVGDGSIPDGNCPGVASAVAIIGALFRSAFHDFRHVDLHLHGFLPVFARFSLFESTESPMV